MKIFWSILKELDKRDITKFFANPIPKTMELHGFLKATSEWKGRVLDAGCGAGLYKRIINKRNDVICVGADIIESKHVDIVTNLESLQFDDGEFDYVYSMQVWEHLENLDAVVAELQRVLKPAGELYCTVPFFWPLHYEPYDYIRFTPFKLQKIGDENNLRVISIRPIGGVFAVIGSLSSNTSSWVIKRSLKRAPRTANVLALLAAATFSLPFLLADLVFKKLDKRTTIGWQVVFQKI